MRKHPCEGCVDAVRSFYGIDGYLCNFALNTGICRSLICPPAEGCTVKSTRPRPERNPAGVDRAGFVIRRRILPSCSQKTIRSHVVPVDRVRGMASKGMSDPQIAKELGFSRDSIYKCRKRNNIPPGLRARGDGKWKE